MMLCLFLFCFKGSFNIFCGELVQLLKKLNDEKRYNELVSIAEECGKDLLNPDTKIINKILFKNIISWYHINALYLMVNN